MEWDGPTTPHESAGSGFECGDETADAFIRPGNADDDIVIDNERSHGTAVFLALVRHRNLPKEISVGAIEREEMSIVGDEEDFLVKNSDASIRAKLGIAREAGGLPPRIGPKLRASKSVDRQDLVRSSEIEDAIGGERSGF